MLCRPAIPWIESGKISDCHEAPRSQTHCRLAWSLGHVARGFDAARESIDRHGPGGWTFRCHVLCSQERRFRPRARCVAGSTERMRVLRPFCSPCAGPQRSSPSAVRQRFCSTCTGIDTVCICPLCRVSVWPASRPSCRFLISAFPDPLFQFVP
jgi:hypothetical protein